jgi:hypothetical protein
VSVLDACVFSDTVFCYTRRAPTPSMCSACVAMQFMGLLLHSTMHHTRTHRLSSPSLFLSLYSSLSLHSLSLFPPSLCYCTAQCTARGRMTVCCYTRTRTRARRRSQLQLQGHAMCPCIACIACRSRVYGLLRALRALRATRSIYAHWRARGHGARPRACRLSVHSRARKPWGGGMHSGSRP